MKPKYPRLSPEDEKAFLKALAEIWDMVGYDCLVATAEEKGKKTKPTYDGELAPAEQVTMQRSTVIDIVTDQFAQRPHADGMGRAAMPAEQYKRIRTWMIATPAHIVDKVVRKQFTARHYGA